MKGKKKAPFHEGMGDQPSSKPCWAKPGSPEKKREWLGLKAASLMDGRPPLRKKHRGEKEPKKNAQGGTPSQ